MNLTDKPDVSIIIPAYKAEKYILHALESVGMQTYQNWEIIIVEDGCVDRTKEIVSSFADKTAEHRIVFIRHDINKGLGAARNTAIRHAKGKYAAFLDPDDIWMPLHLERTMAVFKKYDPDLVYTTAIMFEDEPQEEPVAFGPLAEDRENFPVFLYTSPRMPCCGIVVKKRSIETIGLFCEDALGVEDLDCWIKMARADFKLMHIGGAHSFYRKHGSALTRDHKLMVENTLSVLKKHREWDAVPLTIKEERIGALYCEMAYIHIKSNPFKAAKYLICAWLQRPRIRPHYVRHIGSVIKWLAMKYVFGTRKRPPR